MLFIALSNDLRWAATGTWHGKHAAVFDLEKKELARKIATGRTDVCFTNDSKHLVCGGGRIVELGSWNERQLSFPQDQVNFVGASQHPADSPYAFVSVRNTNAKLAIVEMKNLELLTRISTSSRGVAQLHGTTPSGNRIIVGEFGPDINDLNLLNVAKLREQLKDMGLDW